jgi:glucose/arabinose dehydrogenase
MEPPRWSRAAGRAVLACFVAAAVLGCKRPTEERRDRPPPPADPAAPAAPAPAAAAPAASGKDDPLAAAGDLGPVSTELGAPPAELAARLKLAEVVRGLSRPVGLEHAPGDDSGRLFVVEQHVARIVIVRDGAVSPEPFFDLKGNVSKGNEQGLLGLAFHPRFSENGKLYVDYTDRKGTTRIVEYRVSASDPDRVDMSSAREIYSLEQPFSNHNGGYLEFGPDGKLYVGTGDGGAANDPLRAGQDPNTELAKMLRIDVDSATPRAEIVAKGLRNPWRFHFDPATGDLYIADVGQNEWEWVHVTPAGELEGRNFGWNILEGSRCFRRKTCDKTGLTLPVIEYPHPTGCSITGGVVYRGEALPALRGHYFYSDFCTALLRSFRWSRDGVRQHWDWKPSLDPESRLATISAFGTDAAGEMYILSLDGIIWKLVPAP